MQKSNAYMKDGIININKPAGWTSQDVCAKLRRRLHIRKIGHTGTLDPMATGVLPVCIGKATRIVEYYDKDMKTYHARMKLGTVTDTLDITGRVLEENKAIIVSQAADGRSGGEYAPAGSRNCEIFERDIYNAFAQYSGVIAQIPPKYSALKIDGRRAYDLARSGAEFEMKPREIYISSNEIVSIDSDAGIIEFNVTCSKGTYIRTICDDIGRMLGCGAVMTYLQRTASGFFRIDDSVDINELCEMSDEEIMKRIIPMDETLVSLGEIVLDDNRITAFLNGNPSFDGCCCIRALSGYGNLYRVYGGGHFLGIGELLRDDSESSASLIPRKVINSI